MKPQILFITLMSFAISLPASALRGVEPLVPRRVILQLTRASEGVTRLAILEVPSRKMRVVGPKGAMIPAWMPDGEGYLYSTLEGGLYLHHPKLRSGRDLLIARSPSSDAQVDPLGRWIAFTEGHHLKVIASPVLEKSPRPKTLKVDLPVACKNESPHWVPLGNEVVLLCRAGKKIVYVSVPEGKVLEQQMETGGFLGWRGTELLAENNLEILQIPRLGQPTQLTTLKSGEWALYLRSADALAISHEGQWDLHWLSGANRGRKPWLKFSGEVEFSRDGSWAFLTEKFKAPGHSEGVESGDVFLVQVGNQERTKILDSKDRSVTFELLNAWP